jgi:hypothetical protein
LLNFLVRQTPYNASNYRLLQPTQVFFRLFVYQIVQKNYGFFYRHSFMA